MNLRFVIKTWLPVLAWTAFIFIGSTDLLSAAHTSRFIGPFLRWFVPDVSDATIGTVQLLVRKCGHITEYAILAALIYRALRQHLLPALAVTFVFAGSYAALDEFHQSFVASRSASFWDFLIDCAGAMIGLVIYRLVNRKSKIENRK
jgi:VanZ family protein